MKFLSIIVGGTLLFVSMTGLADEAAPPAPLFPISIEQEFPNAHESYDEVTKLILDNYYSPVISEKDLYWAAIEGMLRHISPPDTPELGKIWSPEEYEKIENSLRGRNVSIGIRSSLNLSDGSLTVTEVLPGSPAETLLLPYDRILRINGKPLKGVTAAEVDRLLEGEPDTPVGLTVIRDIQVFDLTITRKEFRTQEIVVDVLPPGDIAWVEVRKITADISKDLKNQLAELQGKGVRRLILDLRGNTGGVFVEALRLAELFLAEKTVLARTVWRSKPLQNYVSSNTEPFTFELALLVNQQTASSCEIIVGALQDNQRALVIGAKTFGKAVFEQTFTLQNGYHVKFIAGAMYTPKGSSWQGRGILPDFAVEQDDKTLTALRALAPVERLKKDIHLITAYKLLNK